MYEPAVSEEVISIVFSADGRRAKQELARGGAADDQARLGRKRFGSLQKRSVERPVFEDCGACEFFGGPYDIEESVHTCYCVYIFYSKKVTAAARGSTYIFIAART